MKTALRIIESFMLCVFFGLVPVMAIFMTTVLFAAIVFGKETLGPWILLGMLPGVLIDVLFLKRWVKNAYQMSSKIIGGLYVFYSVCALGFFMGIPIGCVLLSIPAGIYSARRFLHGSDDRHVAMDYFKKTAFFTAVVMVLMCVLITLLAIAGKMIGYEVEFPVSFTLTAPVFWAVVFTGGGFLVLLQYWLTSKAAKVTFNLSN